MDKDLVIDLMTKEIYRLRREVAALTPKRAGAVANLLGVTNEEIGEAGRLADETFKAAKNLRSDDDGLPFPPDDAPEVTVP